MKILGYTAAALIALLLAAPALAQNSTVQGTTGPTVPPSMSPSSEGHLRNSPGQNEAVQKGSNGQLAPQQNAQMPGSCTPADQSCGNANGNPAMNSPTQKKEVPANPAPTTNP